MQEAAKKWSPTETQEVCADCSYSCVTDALIRNLISNASPMTQRARRLLIHCFNEKGVLAYSRKPVSSLQRRSPCTIYYCLNCIDCRNVCLVNTASCMVFIELFSRVIDRLRF